MTPLEEESLVILTMLIGSGRKLHHAIYITVEVFNDELELVEDFRYVGVIFSSHATWSDHIDQLSAKINKLLGLLKRVKHLLPRFARLFRAVVL